MGDPRFDLAIAALRTVEDAISDIEWLPFGGIYRCPVAPTLPNLNYVRVDDVGGDVPAAAATAAEARTVAREHSLRTIVLDDPIPNVNWAFEQQAPDGEWCRVRRCIYVCEDRPQVTTAARLVELDEFASARRAFYAGQGDVDDPEIAEDQAALRLVADRLTTQQWGTFDTGSLVSVGEIYVIGNAVQLESLSTLQGREGLHFGRAVTAARADEAFRLNPEIVFAQIEAGNGASIHVHERLGFTCVGSRTTFSLREEGCSSDANGGA